MFCFLFLSLTRISFTNAIFFSHSQQIWNKIKDVTIRANPIHRRFVLWCLFEVMFREGKKNIPKYLRNIPRWDKSFFAHFRNCVEIVAKVTIELTWKSERFECLKISSRLSTIVWNKRKYPLQWTISLSIQSKTSSERTTCLYELIDLFSFEIVSFDLD